MTGVIRIKKKDVRKILSLYTIEGLSQKETGQIVLGSGDIQGVSTYAVAQRVLHYFGLNMDYRRDYKHDGLTEDIIDLILDNRTLAFPLAIPVDGKFNAALNFDAEVNKYLSGDSKRWNVIGRIKNFSVVALLIFLTYFLAITENEMIGSLVVFISFMGPMLISILLEGGAAGKGIENRRIGDIIVDILPGFIFFVGVCIIAILSFFNVI